MSNPRFRRPAMLSPDDAEQIAGGVDPAQRSELAHTTAVALVSGGRDNAADAALVGRLVNLVDTEGLDAVAAMWAESPAPTLPGALWRLYLLREWTRRDPHTISERYRLGLHRAEVAGVVAGVAAPPDPEAVRQLADQVLSGLFRGDLDVALDRAAAFLRVLATGSALDADWVELSDAERAASITRAAGNLLDTAADLEHAAALWRDDRLD